MKNLKKYVGVLMLLFLLVGFTSCEDDETIFDRIVGRTWIGDLGFESDDRYHDPLESGIYLGADGFGEDQLCYYDNGDYYGKPLRLQEMVPFILIMVMLLLRVNCVMYMLVMDV